MTGDKSAAINRREFGKQMGALVVGATFATSEVSLRTPKNRTTYFQVNMKLPAEVAGIPLIDSKIAQEATELMRATSTPSLFNHSMRTYLFGALLGKDLSFDYELLYLASVLHDLGLTEKYAGDRSFEIEGAEAARKFLGERGLSEERSGIVWDGIAMHPYAMANYKRPEIALVANGAAADVVGSDIAKVAPARKEQVLRAFPRLGFKTNFTQTCAEVVRRHPGGAYRSFMRDIGERHVLGFQVPNICDAIAAAPFAE
jgi:HD domain